MPWRSNWSRTGSERSYFIGTLTEMDCPSTSHAQPSAAYVELLVRIEVHVEGACECGKQEDHSEVESGP